MREWLDGLLAILLAPACAACGRLLPHPTLGCVCAECWSRVTPDNEPLCRRCGDPLDVRAGGSMCFACAGNTSHIDRARAIGPHGGPLRDIVHALKYDGRRTLARPLAERMRAVGSSLIHAADAAVPVPLHRARRRERGFNQASDLARHLGLPVVHALERTRHTETQTALPAAARRANVADAFRVTRQVRRLRDARVLLVDDVRTTGATLQECARALKLAGVREVLALTAARVSTPGG